MKDRNKAHSVKEDREQLLSVLKSINYKSIIPKRILFTIFVRR